MTKNQIKSIVKKIKKRNGKLVKFVPKKILKAIEGGFRSAGEDNQNGVWQVYKDVISEIDKRFNGTIIPEVEQIQDLIEEILRKDDFDEVAKAFKLYRELHQKFRMISSLVDSDELIDKYISGADWRIKENANMTYSLQGLNNHVASIISANYWMNKIYDKEIRKAHLSGDIHIHDLASLSPYCTGWDLKDFLMKGFGGVPGKIHSTPPKHLRTALGQLVNFFYTIQGEVAGAVAMSNFDTYMAPFIRYDNLDFKHVKQALQEFIFNMNVPTRVGFQTPFTNVSFDLVPTKMVGEESVIFGGKVTKDKYKDFQKEMDMFNRAFAEVMMEGDSQGRVFTFPIPTYSLTKDFDWDNKNLDAVWEMTRKYGIPYFSNFVNSDLNPDDARSMCCRLRLDNRELRKRGGLFSANPLTGAVGVVTINMPRIGYLAKQSTDNFEQAKKKYFSMLGRLMDIAKDSLVAKRDQVEMLTEKGLYPYCSYYLQGIYERNGVYWRNHFNTIGLNGMNESLINLIGKDISNPEAKEFAVDVMEYMREKILLYQKETGEMFNLEATPAEGTAYRFAKLDKKLFPNIKTMGDKVPFYTNSTHLPVNYTDDIFTALDHQDALQTRYNGGTVLHGFMNESLPDIGAVKKLVKKIAYNYHLPYFSITPTFSICPKHGYMAGEHQYCPKCDIEIGYKVSAKGGSKKKEQEK
jgi:ribonucleoside-triphosphate reductase (formate)